MKTVSASLIQIPGTWKIKKGIMGLNYNYQVGIDPKYGFIVDNYITQNLNDQNELLTLTKRLNTILGSDDYVL